MRDNHIQLPANLPVLIVEDEYLVAMALAEDLEAAGAEVVGPAATLDGALALIDGVLPLGAAVLDIELQGYLVFPLADALIARGVPFIFMTGHGAEAVPPEYGDVLQCEKPAPGSEVLKMLMRCMERKG